MRPRSPEKPSARCRGAFTLVELLISMTITLVMVYALVEFMKYVGDTVTEGRGQIEMAGSVRSVRRQLYKDLQLVTVYWKPSPDIDSGNGYLEIAEGFRSDSNPNGTDPATYTVEVNTPNLDRDGNGKDDDGEGKGPANGDCDDFLAFTARNVGDPFVGLFGGSTYNSELAELVWFVSHFTYDAAGVSTNTFSDPTRLAECTLYRRVLLIRPDLNVYDSTNDVSHLPTTVVSGQPFTGVTAYADACKALRDFWQLNDISARVVQRGSNFFIAANTLGDLSRRENRFAHVPVTFPGQIDMAPDRDYLLSDSTQATKCPFILKGARLGEDIMLSHVTAFDLRVYDPQAYVRRDSTDSTVLTPGDPGYTAAGVVDEGQGTFVDIGYRRFVDYTQAPTSLTSAQANSLPFYWPVKPVANKYPRLSQGLFNSGTFDANTMLFGTYDTWSFSYEHDGINQSDGCYDSTIAMPTALTLTDEGTDGIDNDKQNGVDDPGEREVFPPCPVILSGLQARIRIYDHSLRIGKQVTVIAEFTK